MSELLPLPIWGAPQPGDMEALRRAKAALGAPFLIAPCVAVPGSPTRVLALREPPPFVTDYALVADPANDAAMLAAMRWALDDDVYDKRATSVLDMLREQFGPDVQEVAILQDIPDLGGDERYPQPTRRHDPND